MAILVAGCLVLAAAGEVAARIPSFQGTTFAGQTVSLPQQLKGGVGVLVLGFSKSSGGVCKDWGQRLAENYGGSHDVMYFQMPVLESVPKLIRGMVMRSIKSGVPEAEQPHFLPVFSNEAEWRTIARYTNPDDAYILVVDGQGIVRWQTSGKVTDAGFAALKQQVETARTQLRESNPNRIAQRSFEDGRLRNILLAMCVCICSGV
jgi:ATP10 protein